MLREFKPAFLFLLRFVGIYLISTVFYGVFVKNSQPYPDGITRWVTTQAIWLLDMPYGPVATKERLGYTTEKLSTKNPWSGVGAAISLYTGNGEAMVSVYEGCNGFVVAVLFIAFLVAFGGPLRAMILYGIIGVVLIHMANLCRIFALAVVSLKYPSALFFAHKYVFTGVIYAFVFILWYLWIVKWGKPKPSA
jgi:exosortase family protein XrtF